MNFGLDTITQDTAGTAVPVVRVSGEIDVTDAPALHEALAGLASPALIIDLAQVRYLDSAALAVLHRLVRHQRVAVVVPPGSVLHTAVTLVRLPCHDTVEAAGAALQPG